MSMRPWRRKPVSDGAIARLVGRCAERLYGSTQYQRQTVESRLKQWRWMILARGGGKMLTSFSGLTSPAALLPTIKYGNRHIKRNCHHL